MTVAQIKKIRSEKKNTPSLEPDIASDDSLDVSEDGLHVSEAEYWEKYYNHPDFNYEWNNGILEEKPVADYSKSLMYRWFLQLLEHFLRVHPIAKMTLLEIGFRLALPAKTSIRIPDLGILLNDNPQDIALKDRSYKGTFDLIVESLSDSAKKEIERDTIYKKEEYEKIGVKEYYILDDTGKHMAFYQRNQHGFYIPIPPVKDNIIQSVTLSGFQFRIADLYKQPSLLEMSADEVYRDFVLPEYQREKARANAEAIARQKAEAQAETEYVARQQAEYRIATLETRLQELQARYELDESNLSDSSDSSQDS